MTRLYRLAACLLLFLASCDPARELQLGSPLNLASFTEHEVTVNIALEVDENGQAWLVATFIPEKGKHLYSKDLPRNGVDGLGRPTLLELVPGSRLQPAGTLSESVAAVQADGPVGLLVYPEGPVALRLLVILPEGAGWFDEQVSVTYMACSSELCCPPVIGKLVSVRVPGLQEVLP
jgi:hypothetical protein